MNGHAARRPEAHPITACTISRDVRTFDLLIEDMEAALGDCWGDLGLGEALAFLDQPGARDLVFLALALDKEDEAEMPLLIEIVTAARTRGVKVIVIAEDLRPAALHRLLREGAQEFIPYPLPEDELSRTIERLLAPPDPADAHPKRKALDDRDGVVLPVHGLAGGTGATTLAVNLAWELALLDPDKPAHVCLLDLDLQFGSAATHLDLPRREAVLELISDTAAMDAEAFMQALLTYKGRLHVLTAPSDMVPLDLLGPADIQRLIDMARRNFDYVVVDMPSTFVEWTQTVLEAAHVYFAPLELDMRSAQNALRIKRALQSEELPFEKLRFVLNRCPRFTDLNGRSRVKRMAEGLGIAIEVQLADGGRPVSQAADQGIPLAEEIPRNPLRKDIAKLAKSVHRINTAQGVAA